MKQIKRTYQDIVKDLESVKSLINLENQKKEKNIGEFNVDDFTNYKVREKELEKEKDIYLKEIKENYVEAIAYNFSIQKYKGFKIWRVAPNKAFKVKVFQKNDKTCSVLIMSRLITFNHITFEYYQRLTDKELFDLETKANLKADKRKKFFIENQTY